MATRVKFEPRLRIEESGRHRKLASLVKKVVRCAPCGDKILWATRARAGRHVHRIAENDPRRSLLQIYPCPHRAGWHVGHGKFHSDDVAQPTEAAAADRASGAPPARMTFGPKGESGGREES